MNSSKLQDSEIVRNNLPIRELPAILLVASFFVFSGCSRPDSAPAVARTSGQTATLYSDGADETDSANNTGLNNGNRTGPDSNNNGDSTVPSFIGSGHFAVVRIKPAAIAQSEDYRELPMNSLQESLADLVGSDNAEFDRIRAVWIMLNREQIENGDGTPPWTVVVRYNQPVNQDQLDQALENLDIVQRGEPGDLPDTNEEEEPGREIRLPAFRLLDDQTLAIGPGDAIDKMIESDPPDQTLQSELIRFSKDREIEAAVSIAPLRDLLQTLFAGISRFAGDDFKKYENLPELVSTCRLSVDIDGGDAVHAVINIDDDELGEEIARQISALLQSDGAGEGGGGIAGLLPMPFSGNREKPVPMIQPESESEIEQLVEEIQRHELFRIRSLPGQVEFTLKKPEALKDAIFALVQDSLRQIELTSRINRMQVVADALESYEEQYGCLPPVGPISPEQAAERNLPAQLNWMSGLLPQMNEQPLYDRFDFSKPWDHRDNLKVARSAPLPFAVTPETGEEEESSDTVIATTRMKLVINDSAVYKPDAETAPKLSEISDRTNWTALVVEGNENSAAPWTAPADGVTGKMQDYGNEKENGVLLINAGFKTRILKRDADAWSAVLSSSGDENLSRRQFIPTDAGGGLPIPGFGG